MPTITSEDIEREDENRWRAVAPSVSAGLFMGLFGACASITPFAILITFFKAGDALLQLGIPLAFAALYWLEIYQLKPSERFAARVLRRVRGVNLDIQAFRNAQIVGKLLSIAFLIAGVTAYTNIVR